MSRYEPCAGNSTASTCRWNIFVVAQVSKVVKALTNMKVERTLYVSMSLWVSKITHRLTCVIGLIAKLSPTRDRQFGSMAAHLPGFRFFLGNRVCNKSHVPWWEAHVIRVVRTVLDGRKVRSHGDTESMRTINLVFWILYANDQRRRKGYLSASYKHNGRIGRNTLIITMESMEKKSTETRKKYNFSLISGFHSRFHVLILNVFRRDYQHNFQTCFGNMYCTAVCNTKFDQSSSHRS